MVKEVILRNAHIISPADNLDEILDINIEDGVIVDIAKNIPDNGAQCIDLSDKVIVPGLVDMHCHLREPGFEYKETIKTGVESALNGGFVAVCPMANTNPVADNVETIKFEVEKAAAIGGVNVFSIAAVTKGLEGKELVDFKALKQAGAVAFSDDGKPFWNWELFEEALNSGELIISHADDEAFEVEKEIEILKNVGGKLHFAHISTKVAIDLIRQAKKDGLNVTCETAPHYFTFTKEDETQKEPFNGRFKMNPPLGSKEDLQAVIKGLQDGTIDCIATDHAPHSMEEKTKPFAQSPFGIVGFETALSASLKLVYDEHLTLNQFVEKMSVNPAKILNLKTNGQVKIGQLANLTIIDTDIIYTIRADEFKTKCKITPFEGLEYRGKTSAVIINGKMYTNKQYITSS